MRAKFFLLVTLTSLAAARGLSAQTTCSQPMVLRQETCPAGATTCSTKTADPLDVLSWLELDRWALNVIDACNGPMKFNWGVTPSSGFLRSDGSGVLSIAAASGVGACGAGQFVSAVNNNAAPTCGTPAGGGVAAILDLADNGVNESTGITEIATSGDTNSIFTEPAADKLLINAGLPWLTASALAANPANCSAGQYPLGIAASGAVESCTADDDTPDSDAEIPDVHTLAGGTLGSNTLSGALLTSGLVAEPGQANLGANPHRLGLTDGSVGSPVTSTEPSVTFERWDATGSGATAISYQQMCTHQSGSGFHYCSDTWARDNSRNSNDVTALDGRIIKEPFGLVQGLGATPSTSGGTLATATYAYYVDAAVAGERILGSQHVTAAVTGPTGSVSLSWTALSGATGYRVYRYIPAAPATSTVYFDSASTSFTDTGGAGTAGIGLPSTGWGVWAQCAVSAHSARCASLEAGVVNSSGQHAPYRPDVVGSTIGVQIPSAGAHNNSIGLHVTSGGTSFRRGIVLDGSSFSEYGIDLSDSPASSPALRLANNQTLVTRNAANSADVIVLKADASNMVQLGGGAATVDPTNQRLGIVTTSPDERFEIEEVANASTIGLVQNTSTGSAAIAIWRAESDGALIGLQAHGSGRVASRFGVTVANYGEILQTTGNGFLLGTSAATPLILGTASVARMTINSDGSIDIPQMSVPSNPASGTRRLFVDSSTGKISVRTSAGATVSLEEAGGGGGGNSFTTIDTTSGTDPVADSTTDTLLVAAGDGLLVTGDSTADSVTIARKDPLVYVDMVDEFCSRNTTSGITGSLNWSNYGSNTPGQGIADAAHPCFLSMFTTTSSGNVQAIGLGKNSNEDNWKTADHLDRMTWVIKTDTVITNLEIRVGFMDDASSTTGGDGFFIEYDPAVNGFWRCITRQGGTSTTTNSAVTVAVSTWYQLEIDQDGSGNLRCYANNAGTSFASHSTNKPTGTLNMGLAMQTNDAVSKTLWYDFFRLRGKALGARF